MTLLLFLIAFPFQVFADSNNFDYQCVSLKDSSKTASIVYDRSLPNKVHFSAEWFKAGRTFVGQLEGASGVPEFQFPDFSPNPRFDKMSLFLSQDLMNGFPGKASLTAIDDNTVIDSFNCHRRESTSVPPVERPNLSGFNRILINKPYETDPKLLAMIGSRVVIDTAGIIATPIVGLYPQDILLQSQLDLETQKNIEMLVALSAKKNVEYCFWKINLNDGRTAYTKPDTDNYNLGVESNRSLLKALSEIQKIDPVVRKNVASIELFHTHPGNTPLSEVDGDIDNNWQRAYKFNLTAHVYAVSIKKSPVGRILFHYANSPK